MLKPLWNKMRYVKVHYGVRTFKPGNIYHIAVPEWMDVRLFDCSIVLCGTLSDAEGIRDRIKESKYVIVRKPPRGRKLCKLCKANYEKLKRLLGEYDNDIFSKHPSAATSTWKRDSLAIRSGRFTRKSRGGIKEVRDVFADYERARPLVGCLSRDFRCSDVFTPTNP